MDEYKTVTRTITLVLEDVTDSMAEEFFARLTGTEIALVLSDDLEYVAVVQ